MTTVAAARRLLPESRVRRLARELTERELSALVIVADSARDSHSAPFTGSAHIGEHVLIAEARGDQAEMHLGFLSPLDRGEALATGLNLMTPADLALADLRKQGVSASETLASVLSRALAQIGVSSGSTEQPTVIGLAGHSAVGRVCEASAILAGKGFRCIDGGPVVAAVRKTKTDLEIGEVERSASAVCAAFHRVAEVLRQAAEESAAVAAAGSRTAGSGAELSWLQQPLTVARLRLELSRLFGGLGLEQPRGNIVAPGEEGAVPHNAGTDERVLRAGESLVVDLYPKGLLFADCTRTFCVGPVSDRLADAHRDVADALEWSHSHIRAGRSPWQLQVGVCDLLAGRGHATVLSDPSTEVGYVHSLGHGVGFDLHEEPFFRKSEGRSQIEVGDVITLEPGLYDPTAGFGVRLEDLVVVERSGPRNLTPLPYELDPFAWVS